MATKEYQLTNEPRKKRQEDVLWFKILDRFGLPTLFALIMLIYMMRIGEQQLQMMNREREANREVLSAIAQSMHETSVNLQRLSDKLDRRENLP